MPVSAVSLFRRFQITLSSIHRLTHIFAVNAYRADFADYGETDFEREITSTRRPMVETTMLLTSLGELISYVALGTLFCQLLCSQV